MGRTGKDVTVFVGNSAYPILATAGGLVEHLVKLKDKVEAGQKVAIQRDNFGEVIAEYTSGVAGEITGQRSDAMSEPGNPLVFILFNKATPDGGEIYPEIQHLVPASDGGGPQQAASPYKIFARR